MRAPLLLLAVGAVLAGVVFTGFFIGEGRPEFWGRSLFSAPGNHIYEEMHHVPEWVYVAPAIAMLLGFGLAWLFYIQVPALPEATARAFRPLYLFLLNKWYFDELYDWLFVRPAMAIGRMFWKTGDGRIIDGLGPDGVAQRVQDVTSRVVRLQSGYVHHYAFAMVIGLAIIVTYLMYTGGAFR
jgi:NADH-quinone oxidoreductase subunit L